MGAKTNPSISLVDGVPIVSSLQVAEHFEKPHRNVLRDIRALIDAAPECELNFEQTVITRPNPSGGKDISSPAYTLTRDGFTLLAMGFTGQKALKWKIRYIEAFNAMEAALQDRAQAQVDSEEARAAARDVFDFINQACRLGGGA